MSAVTVKPTTTTPAAPLPEMSDEQLLLKYCETRDPCYYSEIVKRYERELYSYLRRYLGHAEMAEDAFQATFLQLHLKCEQFDVTRKLRPWLYMIATNKAIDLQRRSKRHRMLSLDGSGKSEGDETGRLVDLLVSDDPGPVKRLDEVERGQWVRDALQELPEHLSLVVNLVYYQGLKYREAAEVLSIPVGTVKSRLHAAITKLTGEWDTAQQDSK